MSLEYIKYPDILQFELTSMCNALCLGCSRTDTTNFNFSKPNIPKKSIMSLDAFSNIFNSKAAEKVRKVEFCGTIDEPLMHPEFFEIIDILFKTRPDIEISIHTNGSLRSESDWIELAHSLNRFKKYMVWFGIDGLDDTHVLYRQFTDFDKIIKNSSAFIGAGGIAGWQYIIFPWNKHQINNATQMAKKIGFKEFKTRNDMLWVHQLLKPEMK